MSEFCKLEKIPARRFHKVLLISLPAVLESNDDYLDDENYGYSFHLGLAYVAEALRQDDYCVEILDCYAENQQNRRPNYEPGWIELGLSDEEIRDRLLASAPDLVGITIPFSCQHYMAHKIGALVKSVLPNVIIVAGGNHVTAIPEKIDLNIFDYLIIGEGENALPQLIQSLNAGNPLGRIPGLYLPGASAKTTLVKDLDSLSYPAIDLLPLAKIWRSKRRWITMLATRGCVYDCNFCSIHTTAGYQIRRRSIEKVVAEIDYWNDRYKLHDIMFEDDNLTTDRRWAKEFFRQLADRHFGIRFHVRNGIRADSIDLEMLELMKAAGFHDFMIAPESGSQETLDNIIGKNMKLEDCENAITLAKRVGMGVNVFFVLGFPEENWHDLEVTINYARKLKEMGSVGCWISLVSPFPGTRVYRQCIGEGLIDPDKIDYRRLRSVDYLIEHDIFERDDLKHFREKAMEELKPDRSLYRKVWKACLLIVTDPKFFWMKLRYKIIGLP